MGVTTGTITNSGRFSALIVTSDSDLVYSVKDIRISVSVFSVFNFAFLGSERQFYLIRRLEVPTT